MAGQTLHDRLIAAKHTLSGQNVARAVCKATTEELIGPKKKHLDYLIHCTNEPNVSVPELCNILIQRTQQSSWVMVFKSLITAHHLMCYGNERFIQCMATSSCTFHLSNFVDRTASQGYDMSTFVRRYAKYLNIKAATYRTMGADFCKIKRGKEEGVLRLMNTDSLLKTLPILHEQLDALIEFDCNPDDLTNGVMNSCFMLLYRDLIQLFAAYNDGIINLFEKYFNMNKKHCKEALDIYKRFIVAMDKVSDFLKVAESVGIDKGSIPDLTKAPGSLLEEMENHLTFLEGKKSQMTPRSNSIQTAVSALNTTSSAFTSSITSAHELNGLTVDESMRRAVEEEAAIMNQLKEQRLKEIASRQPTAETQGSKIPSPLPPPSATLRESAAKAAAVVYPGATPESNTESLMSELSSNSATLQMSSYHHQVPFSNFGFEGMNPTLAPAEFASAVTFNAAFPTDVKASFDAFGEVLQPRSSSSASPQPSTGAPEEAESPTGAAKLISSDLDSSLQTLVQNLDINGPKKPSKPGGGHQWGSPKAPSKTGRTGGATWSPSAVPISNYGQNVTPMAMSIGQFPVGGVVTVPGYSYQPQAVPAMMPQQPYRMPGVMWSSPPPFGGGVALQQMPAGMYVVAPQHAVIPQGTATAGPVAPRPSNDPFRVL